MDSLFGGFPKGSLILLAGSPGTGKTVFAARFLYSGAAVFGESGIYVSFAESRETFYSQMRGLGFNFERLEEEGKFRFLDMVTAREEGTPTTLEMLLGQIHALKAKRVVVDSFSALASAFKERIDARIILHNIMSKTVRQAGCTTILTVETPTGEERMGLGMEEFVADVVVRLLRRDYEGRFLREVEVLKLRGCEVKHPRLVFTLNDGFKVFQPLTLKSIEEPRKYKPIPHTGTCLSTGIQGLDEVLGQGFRNGTYNLIEVGRDVPFPLIRLLRPTICNFANQGHGIVILPPCGISARQSKLTLAPPLDNGTFHRCVRVVDFGDEAKAPWVVKVGGKSIEDDMRVFWESASNLKEQTGKPVLSVVGFDSIEYVYGRKEGLKILGRDIALVRNLEDVRLNIARPSITLTEQLGAIADIYLKVDEIDGALFVYGVKPRTTLFSFDVLTHEGVSQVKLTPIV